MTSEKSNDSKQNKSGDSMRLMIFVDCCIKISGWSLRNPLLQFDLQGTHCEHAHSLRFRKKPKKYVVQSVPFDQPCFLRPLHLVLCCFGSPSLALGATEWENAKIGGTHQFSRRICMPFKVLNCKSPPSQIWVSLLCLWLR